MMLRDKLLVYIVRKMDSLEDEQKTLRLQTRLEPMDALDHYEVMRAQIRIDTWNEFVHELYKIIINTK